MQNSSVQNIEKVGVDEHGYQEIQQQIGAQLPPANELASLSKQAMKSSKRKHRKSVENRQDADEQEIDQLDELYNDPPFLSMSMEMPVQQLLDTEMPDLPPPPPESVPDLPLPEVVFQETSDQVATKGCNPLTSNTLPLPDSNKVDEVFETVPLVKAPSLKKRHKKQKIILETQDDEQLIELGLPPIEAAQNEQPQELNENQQDNISNCDALAILSEIQVPTTSNIEIVVSSLPAVPEPIEVTPSEMARAGSRRVTPFQERAPLFEEKELNDDLLALNKNAEPDSKLQSNQTNLTKEEIVEKMIQAIERNAQIRNHLFTEISNDIASEIQHLDEVQMELNEIRVRFGLCK